MKEKKESGFPVSRYFLKRLFSFLKKLCPHLLRRNKGDNPNREFFEIHYFYFRKDSSKLRNNHSVRK